MEGDISPEFKKKIRTSLPRRSISFDRETAYNSTSISAALCSSPNSSHVNLVPSTARDSRTSSPERKAKVRLSTDLSTVQESPGTQSHEDLDKEQHSHPNGEASASENTVSTDKGSTLSTEDATGLNIIDDATSHFQLREEQHRLLSDSEDAQKATGADKAVAEVTTTNRALDSGSEEDDVAVKSPPEPGSATSAEEQTNKEREELQLAVNATTFLNTDILNQTSHPAGGTEGEQEDLPRSVPRVVGTDEHLKVPQVGGEGRTSSDSTTVFQGTSDVGKEDAYDRRARDPSQTGSHGREKMSKHTGITESVMEDERMKRRWFKSILKKIPCFN